MTDPDKRNIKNECYHSDAAIRHTGRTDPPRTNAGWLAHFKEQFAGLFIVTAPEAPGGQWRAVRTTGGCRDLSGRRPNCSRRCASFNARTTGSAARNK